MAAATTVITLSTSAYTLVAEGKTTALVAIESKYPARLFLGEALPLATIDTWFPLSPEFPIHFDGMGEDDNIYVMAEAEPAGLTITQKVRVISK